MKKVNTLDHLEELIKHLEAKIKLYRETIKTIKKIQEWDLFKGKKP